MNAIKCRLCANNSTLIQLVLGNDVKDAQPVEANFFYLEDPLENSIWKNNFGFLRLLFASIVIFSHSPQLVDGNNSREVLSYIFGGRPSGHYAVDGFFLVSGYLIAKSFRFSYSIGDYLAKRVLRIYPGFICAFLISTFIVAPLAGGDLTQLSASGIIKKLLVLDSPMVSGAFEGLPSPYLNGSMWTISYEFRCYILIPLIFCVIFLNSRLINVVCLIGLALFYVMRNIIPNPSFGYAVVGNIADDGRLIFVFFIGASFYVWRDLIVFTHRNAILAAMSLVLLMLVPSLAEPAFMVFGGYLIFWYATACPQNRISRMVDRCDPSYGLYLYAWPIQNMLILYIDGIAPWIVTAITLPSALLLGILSWNCIEKPALRNKHLFNPNKINLDGKSNIKQEPVS